MSNIISASATALPRRSFFAAVAALFVGIIVPAPAAAHATQASFLAEEDLDLHEQFETVGEQVDFWRARFYAAATTSDMDAAQEGWVEAWGRFEDLQRLAHERDLARRGIVVRRQA